MVDVEADADGVLLKTLAAQGAAVEVGQPIAVIGEMGETVKDPAALLARLGVAAPNSPAGVATPPGRHDAGDPAPTPLAQGGPATPNGRAPAARILSIPLARRLAKEAGIAAAQLTGAGRGGRIVRRDVEAAVSALAAKTAAASAVPSPDAPTVVAPATPSRTYTDRPHSLMRRAIAERLSASKQTVPHFYLRGTCPTDRLLELGEELNAGGTVRVSLNDLVLKAAARTHLLVLALNVIWTPEAVRSFAGVDIAVAVATEGGLVTPVLRSVEQTPISAMAGQVPEFTAGAKSGRLRPEELEGGTLSVDRHEGSHPLCGRRAVNRPVVHGQRHPHGGTDDHGVVPGVRLLPGRTDREDGGDRESAADPALRVR